MYPTSELTIPALTNMQRQQLLEREAICSLYELFTTIPDYRSKRGQRYTLAYLLTCLAAALLCNCNSTEAIGQWCQEHRALLEDWFGPRRFLCPSASLYRYLLPHLSAEHLEWALADWLRKTLQAADDEPIALDGKTVKGAGTPEQKAPQFLSFCTHNTQEILLQARIDKKTNEIPVAQQLLPCLPVAGRIYTADAMHTSRFCPDRTGFPGRCGTDRQREPAHSPRGSCVLFPGPSCTVANGKDDRLPKRTHRSS
jgi:hypothetical protein